MHFPLNGHILIEYKVICYSYLLLVKLHQILPSIVNCKYLPQILHVQHHNDFDVRIYEYDLDLFVESILLNSRMENHLSMHNLYKLLRFLKTKLLLKHDFYLVQPYFEYGSSPHCSKYLCQVNLKKLHQHVFQYLPHHTYKFQIHQLDHKLSTNSIDIMFFHHL